MKSDLQVRVRSLLTGTLALALLGLGARLGLGLGLGSLSGLRRDLLQPGIQLFEFELTIVHLECARVVWWDVQELGS